MGVQVHKLTSNSHHKNILTSLHQLRIQGQLCDVTVQVDYQGDVQEFQAHQVILAASSGYFKKILLSQNATKEKLLLSNMQSNDFSKFLEFVYSGKIEVTQDKIGDVQAVAQILDCESLSEICTEAVSTGVPQKPRERTRTSKHKPQDASGSTKKGEKTKGCKMVHNPRRYSSNENLHSEKQVETKSIEESENGTEDAVRPNVKEEKEETSLLEPLSDDDWACDDEIKSDDEMQSIDPLFILDTEEEEEEKEKHFFKRKQKKTSTAQFLCNKCMRTFHYEKSYMKHVSTCHGETADVIYCCEVCQQTFAHRSSLKLHVKYVHSTEKLFECDTCAKTFKRKKDVAQHKRQVHEQKQQYVCPDCGKTLSSKATLSLHERTHTGIKPYECTKCQVRFTQKSALNMHLRTHTGERPFACNECDARFTQKQKLAYHKRTHSGLKSFMCNICGKSFGSKEYLKHHLNIHTGSKPFKCDTCERSFAQRNSLYQHLKIHTGERPYKCTVCGKQFTQINALQRHQRIHTGEKPFMCALCKRAFTDQSTFRRHTLVHDIEAPWRTYLVMVEGNMEEKKPRSPTEENAEQAEPWKKTSGSPSGASTAPAVSAPAVSAPAVSTPATSSAHGAGTAQTETTVVPTESVTLPSDWTSHGAIALVNDGALGDITVVHTEYQ
ncbi:GDNF-inducible zinc finger protein 1-like [Nematolebias whitei]|uniref:GDNF-inducible zinc finger protein 1-like n=1 Tax=Nematolebias whitei TaxID=451745 RepID=UPI001896FC88|nr:GDNF-inducible zinc finger protein 1-like [Nematolebias whitei]